MATNSFPLVKALCLLLICAGRRASEDPRQGVNIDVTIPNDAFRKSYVVNLSAGERVHLLGVEESLVDGRARALHNSAKPVKRLAL